MPDITQRYQDVVNHLPQFLDQGFVISRQGSAPIHQGDSLLFSGLALYALPCKEGQPIADAITKMLTDLDGGAYRHPDLAKMEVSLDGLLGLYRGIAKRSFQCGEKDHWKALLVNHKAKVQPSLPAQFNLTLDMLLYKLGLADAPDPKRHSYLELEVASWAGIVKAAKAACYRIHLGLLSLQILEDLGEPTSKSGKDNFGYATIGTKMPTTEHFVGRPGLEDFLANFKYNEWQYRHQRGSWESPDGQGQEHPGVDFLVGYADLYGSPK